MLTDEVLKALIEGIIYVAPEPVTLDGMVKVLEGEERERIKAKLEELTADYEQNAHGIQIRQVANGYKFSTKAEHHEVLRKYVKSLKPLVRLSKPALETLAVIAYRQPVTLPEIDEIRGVDSGGVIHTLLEKKLVVTSGRKSVVGRPILYRTSRDFLVHFGLKDVGELPSLKEFEELAKRALGSEWTTEPAPAPSGELSPPTGEASPPPAAATEAPAIPSDPSAVVAIEPAPETPREESPPVAAETAPLETPGPTEAAPTITEGTGAVSVESPSVPSPEPVPPAATETATLEEKATSAPPSDSPAPERASPSADISPPAAPETETASPHDAAAAPEDPEPKP
jgi:segregation and condensation protein B